MNNLFRSKLLLFMKSNNNKLSKILFSSNSSTQQLLSHEIPLKSMSDTNEDQNVMTMSSMTPMIDSKEIRERQENLIKLLDKCSYHRNKANLVLITGSFRQFQADTKIPSISFKQNSDFIYLTGFTSHQSSDCVLALMGGNGEHIKSILFAPFLDMTQELWDGKDIREHSLWIHSICDDFKDLTELDEFIGSQNGSRQQ